MFKASLSNAVTQNPQDNKIEVFIDGKSVFVPPGSTVLQVLIGLKILHKY